MNKFLVFLCTIAMVFSAVGIASAIPIEDIWDPADVFMDADLSDGSVDQYSWTFDLTDDGFNPDCQNVVPGTAKVFVTLSDHTPDNPDFPHEWVKLTVGTDIFGGWRLEYPTSGLPFALSPAVELTLSDDGIVNAMLEAKGGNFYFESAKLVVEATQCPESPVPEPASMLLMGTGLIGLAGLLGRKKLRKTLMK
ncbi:MAG: PEP-CTERM sorting domain-containing protein [Thermodesulfobacteriota bacterium]|nr:PEP-CTERM sorting domain-containing protein [Thermodesulfobacteriota bacterium]